MTDINLLTIVVASGFLALLMRIPEQDSSRWGFARLSVGCLFELLLTAGIYFPLLYILFGKPAL